MANGKFDGYFLATFCFDAEGALYAEYCTLEATITEDAEQAVIFRRDAEIFALQNDLECHIHGAFLSK